LGEKDILLPTVSRSDTTPSYNSFDVYGIANRPINSYLNIYGEDINEVGILVRSSNNRVDAENGNTGYDNPNIQGDDEKWLAHSEDDFTDLYANSSNYEEGDYLLVPYTKVGRYHRKYGYPLKFAFVNEGDIIIDNDQNNADFDQYNDNHQPSYNSSSEGSKVQGIF